MGAPLQTWEPKRIIQLRSQGLKWRVIADRLGRDINHVQRVAKQHGYNARSVLYQVRCPDGQIVAVTKPTEFAKQHGVSRNIFYGQQRFSKGYSIVAKCDDTQPVHPWRRDYARKTDGVSRSL